MLLGEKACGEDQVRVINLVEEIISLDAVRECDIPRVRLVLKYHICPRSTDIKGP